MSDTQSLDSKPQDDNQELLDDESAITAELTRIKEINAKNTAATDAQDEPAQAGAEVADAEVQDESAQAETEAGETEASSNELIATDDNNELVVPDSDTELAIVEDELAPVDATPEAEVPKKKKRRGLLIALLSVFLVLLLAAGGLAGYIYYLDQENAEIVPNGVSFNGIPVGGMTKAQVQAVIAEQQLPMTQKVLVGSVESSSTQATPSNLKVSEIISFDGETPLQEIMAVRYSADLETRIRHDLLKEEIKQDFKMLYSLDETAVNEYAKKVGQELELLPVDAKYVVAGGIKIEGGTDGYSVDTSQTANAIFEQLNEESLYSDETTLTYKVAGQDTQPENSGEVLKQRKAIYISRSDRRLSLYRGDTLLRSWSVAVGTPSHPTPRGDYRITLKRYMPVWVNPGSEWAKNMPPTIGPGPTAPLGVRALNINAPGIRIHGTPAINSIGTAASHGCVRMRNEEVIQLYDLVEVGTPVFIR